MTAKRGPEQFVSWTLALLGSLGDLEPPEGAHVTVSFQYMSTVRICVAVLLVFVAQFFVAEFQSGELSSHGDRSWGPFPEANRPCVRRQGTLSWVHFMKITRSGFVWLLHALASDGVLVSWASRCQRQIKSIHRFPSPW
jgi:hypothetical protein